MSRDIIYENFEQIRKTKYNSKVFFDKLAIVGNFISRRVSEYYRHYNI